MNSARRDTRRWRLAVLLFPIPFSAAFLHSWLTTPVSASPPQLSPHLQEVPVDSIYLPFVANQCWLSLEFDVAVNVPGVDVNEIKAGICLARTSLESRYGGDIPQETQETINVKIVATGLGNQEPGGGGACCTAFAESGARPFFDVLHADWINGPPEPYTLATHHQIAAAHEYSHAWQWALGCISLHHQPLGDWLNEGIAHYVAHDPFITYAQMTAAAIRQFQLDSADATGETDMPLESLEQAQGIWPGHIGYLAVEKLVTDSPNSLRSIRSVCTSIAQGATVEEAFLGAFGISKSEFYEAFPTYVESLRGTSRPGS